MLFRGGVPYGPDVKRLEAAFPINELTEGRTIQHEELAAVIGVVPSSPRYYAVVKAWMRTQRASQAIQMRIAPKIGVEVMDPATHLTHAEKSLHGKLKQTARACREFSHVDSGRLDILGQRRLEHVQQKVVGLLAGTIQAANKNLAVELAPIKSLPRRQLQVAAQ